MRSLGFTIVERFKGSGSIKTSLVACPAIKYSHYKINRICKIFILRKSNRNLCLRQNNLSLQLEGKLCKVRRGMSTVTFESLPCQRHVTWQTMLNSITCQTKLKLLLQTPFLTTSNFFLTLMILPTITHDLYCLCLILLQNVSIQPNILLCIPCTGLCCSKLG